MTRTWQVSAAVRGSWPKTPSTLRWDQAVAGEVVSVLDADLTLLSQDEHDYTTIRLGGEEVRWLGDMLFVVEHRPSGEFWVVDWTDCACNIPAFAVSPLWRGSWLGLCHHDALLEPFVLREWRDRVWPGWNCGFYPLMHEAMRMEARQVVRDPTRFVWVGTTRCGVAGLLARPDLAEYAQVHPQRLDRLGLAEERDRGRWMLYAAQFGACLGLPLGAPWCAREADCWATEIPTLLVSHGARLQGDPEPGRVWIDVPAPLTVRGWPMDEATTAAAIIQTWQSVREDTVRLRGVARDARKYYEAYGAPASVAQQIAAVVRGN